MSFLFMKGSSGPYVKDLKTKLAENLGADAKLYKALKTASTTIDDELDAAVRAWQSGVGLIADGVIGPRALILLDIIEPQASKFSYLHVPPSASGLTVGDVGQLFPATKPANIGRYLPYLEAALGVMGLNDRAMVLGALGTIRAETEGFVPISEYQSKYNTPVGGTPFSSYDGRYGNKVGDGARFRGRGFIQLTFQANYDQIGKQLDFPLVDNPELGNSPEVAAMVLAQFLKNKASAFRAAMQAGKWGEARKLVNGGSHGLDRFTDVITRAATIWPQAAAPAKPVSRKGKPPVRVGRRFGKGAPLGDMLDDVAASVDITGKAPPKTAVPTTTPRLATPIKARKDGADLRDRPFTPAPFTLPDIYPSDDVIHKFLPAYTAAGMILNQGNEGACTGFGLACVMNYLRWIKGGFAKQYESVSPRMLYTFARRYDEYDGEDYEGSSCRGALRALHNNGVCLESDWPYTSASSSGKYGYATRAARNTLGVYYRIETKAITDMQAAIHQFHAIYVSSYTHDGWDTIASTTKIVKTHADLPVIKFSGKASKDGGHAFALVGFNESGFIIQNSWGKGWGAGGFAVVTYLDWLANGMDAWVLSLGVSGVVAGRLASGMTPGESAMAGGADRSKWWDKSVAYQHSVLFGNDGRVSKYLTEDEPTRSLRHQTYVLPDAWFRSQPKGSTKRLVIYAHGGLNSEADAIARVSAMGRFFLGNGCYPLFLVWKTGLMESISGILADSQRDKPQTVGSAVSDATDWVIEKTVGRPLARPLWCEMKDNAGLAFAAGRGGELLLQALSSLGETWGDDLEVHLIGHSAGSIILGHMLSAMTSQLGPVHEAKLADRLKSIHLYAPACTVAFANQHYASNADVMSKLHLHTLSDKVERSDNVGMVYRKSLLYLVSNALESDLRTPILGLDSIYDESYTGWNGTSDTGEALMKWRRAAEESGVKSKRRSLIDKDQVTTATIGSKAVEIRAAHGSFDNDIDVVSGTLCSVISVPELQMEIDDLRGY
ncbi:hypothetical protein BH10PSE17_BH10PSE17_03570 [soil metagenome]